MIKSNVFSRPINNNNLFIKNVRYYTSDIDLKGFKEFLNVVEDKREIFKYIKGKQGIYM